MNRVKKRTTQLLSFTNLIFLLAVICLTSCNKPKKLNLTRWVNPFIGTAPLHDSSIIGYDPPKGWRVWAGLTYPGAAMPNGMVQLSPVTKFGTGSGYQYEDSVIVGFAHTNKGHWNFCNIPILPVTGKVDPQHLGSHFDHNKETAHPGYYQVYLKDYDINVRLTVTKRCGFHQYKYPGGADKKVVFNLGQSNDHVINWDIHRIGKRALAGYQNTGRKIYFYAKFNQDIEKINKRSKGNSTVSVVHINPDAHDSVVNMKIGLSFVSIQNARLNLQKELQHRNFSSVKKDASKTWEKLLEHVKVTGGTKKEKELFYTSLYRSFLWPVLRSDINGEYRDIRGNVVNSDYDYYTIPSLWDTYRNKLVLMGMMRPKVTADVIKSLIDRGKKTGFIPTFFFGDPASVFVAGSYLRGIQNFNIKKAYKLLVNNATKKGGTRPFIKEYMKKGYVSTPKITNPNVETKAKAGVANTLEYAYADYAIAKLAKALGNNAGYQRFMKRSNNYKNVFDSTTGFMRGRLANGQWVKSFNPQHPYYEYMYREANAWQSTFYVPHDISGLIKLFGSKKRFEAKLDSLFSIPWNPHYIARNISGFIGQYCQGNQPDHNFPYLYYFIGKQEKTQKILNKIMIRFYGIGKKGLALVGMDDAGEMSSWYVFNAMGFYPFSPADTYYLVSVPIFDKIRLKLKNYPPFIVDKKGKGNKIVSLTLNSKMLNNLRIVHKQLTNGGYLIINVE